ncbi:MAG: hypothetical protein ACYTGG_12905 [Planctomycetota bacterium]|jgi:hypothetical protein
MLTIPIRISGDLVRVEAVDDALPITTQPIGPIGTADGPPASLTTARDEAR